MDNKYLQLKLLFILLISIIFCSNAAVTHEKTQDASEEKESEEFENDGVNNVGDDSQNGFAELVKFIDSMNDILVVLKAKLAAQDTRFTALNAKLDAQDQKQVILNKQLTLGVSGLNKGISTQDIKLTAIDAKVDRLTTKTNKIIKIASQLNSLTWEEFDGLIRIQGEHIRTGDSFNRSALSTIESRVTQVGSSGRNIVIVFVNHLDEAIGDFKISDRWNTMYNPAPKSVPGHTQEVFTFAHPYGSNRHIDISFSYTIFSYDIGLAVKLVGTFGAGLAYTPHRADIQAYDETKGIDGSRAWDCCGHVDRNLSVGYKNLYARMFEDNHGKDKATIRIELIKLPLDE